MRHAEAQRLDQLATVADLPDPTTSATAPGAQALSVNQRVEIVMGQSYPHLADGQQWPMSNNALYYFSRALDSRLSFVEQARLTQQQVNALQQQVLDQLLAGATATSAEIVRLRATIELVRLAGVATDARQTADELRLAALEAKDVLQASAIEANRLDILKLQAADALLQTRATTDETAIALAQATATQASALAATAQKKAEDDATALLALQGQLASVQATATQAQQAAAANATALAGKLDASAVKRFTISTPAASLTVGTPATFTVLLPGTLWPDGNYLVFYTKASGSTLLNVQLSDTNKLADRFTATMQTTGLVTVAVAPSTAEVLVFRL